jgi:hypothetical protein
MALPRHIGLDLDNTVIDYRDAYRAVAVTLGFNAEMQSRESIRPVLRLNAEDDDEWQHFQSLLYTEGLSAARPAAGLLEFLQCCQGLGVGVSIVSHKTRATPDRFGGVDLRGPADIWLLENRVVPHLVHASAVFFCSTRAEKVRRIHLLGCEVFVDDLEEVLTDVGFPQGVQRFLYEPGALIETHAKAGIPSADFPALTKWLLSC